MELRRIPLEVIQCRHCEREIRATEKRLCDALLCQDCFNARAIYREEHPRECSDKTEINFLGDQYGKKRLARAVVCAACGHVYELIPSNYVDISIEEQKKHYECVVEFNKNRDVTLKPFKPIVFSYEYAPKGWANEILCKSCFDNIQADYDEEIEQTHTYETERLRTEVAHTKTPMKEPSNNPLSVTLLIMVVVLIAGLFLRFLAVSEGRAGASDKVPFIIYVFFGVLYLLAIPWFMEHGHRVIAKSMVWVAAIVVGFALIAAMPSCSHDQTYNDGELPYYRK